MNQKYTKTDKRKAVALARKTSARNAARAFGMSVPTVLSACRAAGIESRRVGNYSVKERQKMGDLFRTAPDVPNPALE